VQTFYRFSGDNALLLAARSDEVRLIGQSEAMEILRSDIECAARTDAKVLITGETGVGKEVVSRLIHHRSGRASAPLVTLNCAGLPDSLLESELFGHARGSFTGAYRDKPGLLEMAPNGSVFLDEVGEMSMRMQVVLLRFLETGEIQRIGSQSHTRVTVRLITATNRDLQGHIASGAFREDLYFRLNVIRLCIPPLRERRGDIPLLIEHFLDTYARQHHVPRPEVTPAAMDVLMAHRWPGNIRELKNVVERLILKASGQPIRPAALPADVFGPGPAAVAPLESSGSLAAHASAVDSLAARILERGESFWTAVYPDFMSRDLTREVLRKLVQIGLERSNGNYRLLVQNFNMPPGDYKRFLSFLRKHNCHLPFQRFRVVHARVPSASAGPPASERLRAVAKSG
jgi:transcriptional regulator with PAS, ATPase and Fis domain